VFSLKLNSVIVVSDMIHGWPYMLWQGSCCATQTVSVCWLLPHYNILSLSLVPAQSTLSRQLIMDSMFFAYLLPWWSIYYTVDRVLQRVIIEPPIWRHRGVTTTDWFQTLSRKMHQSMGIVCVVRKEWSLSRSYFFGNLLI